MTPTFWEYNLLGLLTPTGGPVNKVEIMMSAESNSEKSVSYQKKDGRSRARPFFFWYDNDRDLKVCFLVTRIIWCLINLLREGFGLFNFFCRWKIFLSRFIRDHVLLRQQTWHTRKHIHSIHKKPLKIITIIILNRCLVWCPAWRKNPNVVKYESLLTWHGPHVKVVSYRLLQVMVHWILVEARVQVLTQVLCQ